MKLSDKPFENLAESDLQSLVDDEVREAKTVEYKKYLPGNSDAEKKEFLADVSSFANAAGGHLVYGVEEKEGIPTKITGLGNIDADAEILRLENTIQNGIDPRPPGVSTRPIGTGLGPAIVLRIPRSFAQPHAVDYKGRWRFYSRNSAGKYPLDVSEVRAAFALSETTTERIRNFRAERLSMIVSGQAPVRLPSATPKFILHILPINFFDPGTKFSISSLDGLVDFLHPICSPPSLNHRHNFDGHLSYGQIEENEPYTYLQVFRAGGVEAAESRFLTHTGGDEPSIPAQYFEEQLLEGVERFLRLQKHLGVELPNIVMLSIVGVSGYVMDVEGRWLTRTLGSSAIDRDALLVPEVMVESFDADPADIMKPIFDAVWNAAGWSRSMNYNEEGKWTGLPG